MFDEQTLLDTFLNMSLSSACFIEALFCKTQNFWSWDYSPQVPDYQIIRISELSYIRLKKFWFSFIYDNLLYNLKMTMGKPMGSLFNPEAFKISRLDNRVFRVGICGLKSNLSVWNMWHILLHSDNIYNKKWRFYHNGKNSMSKIQLMCEWMGIVHTKYILGLVWERSRAH
jgi:hypothetical protein